MADPEETSRVAVPVLGPDGDVRLRLTEAPPPNTELTTPVTPGLQAQFDRAERWQRRVAEVDTADTLEGMAREAGLAWARGAQIATPVFPFLGAAGYGVQQALTPDEGDEESRADIAAFREAHPFLAMLPGAAFDLGAAALTGGATGAGEVIAQQMAARAGGGLGARILAGAGGAAVDAGIAAMQTSVQDAGLRGDPIEAEHVLASGLMGVILGGAVGGAVGPWSMATPGVGRVAGAAGREVAGDLVGEARRLASDPSGMRFLDPPDAGGNAFTRAGSAVSRIDEARIRELQNYGQIAWQETEAVQAAERAAASLQETVVQSDRLIDDVLNDTGRRASRLGELGRVGQQMAGVSDDVVRRRLGDALGEIRDRWRGIEPRDMTDAGARAFRTMSNEFAQSPLYRLAAPDGVDRVFGGAMDLLPEADLLMRRIRAIPNVGEAAAEQAAMEAALRNAITDRSVFGSASEAWRLLDDATNTGRTAAADGTRALSWAEARNQLRQLLGEGSQANGPLQLSGRKLRQAAAPEGGGDRGLQRRLTDARQAYESALTAVEMLTGEEQLLARQAWEMSAAEIGEADIRARARRAAIDLYQSERQAAGVFAGLGIGGMGIAATAGGLAGGPLGAILGGAAAMTFGALSHPASALSVLSKVGEAVGGSAARMQTAVSNLGRVASSGRFERALRSAAASTPTILARLSNRKERNAAYEAISNDLRQMASSPAAMQARLEQTTVPISAAVAPQLGDPAAVAAVNAVQYMVSNLPAIDAPAITLFPDADKMVPSDQEIDDFLVRFSVAVDPVSAVEDAAAGRLTVQGAEALRTMYPLIFRHMQSQVIQALQGVRTPPYDVRVQISTLMNTPADASQTESFIYSMQQQYAQTQAQDRAQRRPGQSQLRGASFSMTSTQQSETRL